MKKTYSKSFRQGLPGGPNEMFEKVKGIIVSERGQWDFPGMNTLVPTDDGRITMRGVPYPVYGQDETGYGQMMYPNQEYQFPGKNVLELPMAQKGLQKKLQPWEYLDKEGNLHTDIDLLPNDPQGLQKYAEELNWMRNWIPNRQSQMQSAIKSYMSRQDEKHPVDALAREYIFSPLFGQPSAYGLSNDWGTTNQELGKNILNNAVKNVNTLKFKDSSKVNPKSYVPSAWGTYSPDNHSIYFLGQNPGGDTKIHEIGHGTRLAKEKLFQDVIQHNLKNDPIYKSNYDDYQHSPEEIYSRIWEIRKGLNLKPTDKITKEILRKKLNENKNSEEYIDLFKHLKPETIINLLNELVYQEPDFQLPMAQVGLQVPVQKPDALRVQMNINPNAEYMEKKKSDVLDLDNTLDYLVETRGGTRDLWGRMADTIGYHESAHTMDPLQMQNSGGPGRGIFQFEAPSLVTAQNRYKRIASKLNLKTDPEILNAKSALELSPEQQYSLFLINLSESQAKLKDYADNKLPLVDLWLQGHKNKEAEGDRGSFRTSVQKAKDKSIQKGYDSFKQLGGSLPRFQNGNQVPAQSEPEPEPFTLPKGKGYYFKEDGETNLPKKMESIEKRNLRFYDFETEEDYVNFLTSEKSKNKDFGCKEDNCAEFANNRAGELVGLSGADLSTWLRGGKYKIGVGGNAWQTYGNILDLGGKSIFNNYKNQGDVSQVKPGDIIGLKKWSVYNHSGRYSIRGENAPKAGVDNSHQGVVEYVDKKGNIYIRHNIHGSTSVKKLTAKNNEYYLGDTGWKIVTAARPNFEKYQHADIDYKPEIGQYYVKPFISDYNPNEEIIFKQDVVKQADPHRYKTRHGNFMAGEAAQKKDWLTGQLNIQGIPVTERAGNEDMQKFVNSLNDNKEKLMHYYHLKNDEFNEIAKYALATAGAESDFGTSSKLKIKESYPALARLIKNARDREIYDSDEMSRGIGQVKPYSLDDIFKQMFGVTKSNINKPEYNALAVFSHLADDIRKVKNWSKKNTDLPEEVRNNYPFLATAAYVNPYTVAAGNLSYDPSFQNDPNKPYEPIGLDNKRLRIISDYIKDVGILNTKNPFAGQKLKEFRVVPEQQLGGSLPRFQNTGQFNPQLARPNPLTGKYAWEQSIPKKTAVNVTPKMQPAVRATTNVQRPGFNLDRDNRLLDAGLQNTNVSSNPLSPYVHTLLDAAGMVPILGEPADFANALLYNYEGDLENTALSTAGMIPFLGMLGTGKRLLGKTVNTPKQLPGSSNVGKGFKPEIDWSKWNPETPKHKVLIDEYDAIEEASKRDGTWMKNADGSPYRGTPEMFVQEKSSWFKKAYPQGYDESFRGVGIYNNDPDFSKSQSFLGDNLSGDRGVFTANKGLASAYAAGSDILTPFSKKYDTGLFNLIHPKGKQIIYDVGHNSWLDINLAKNSSKNNLQAQIDFTKKHLNNLIKNKDVDPSTIIKQQELLEDLQMRFDNFDNLNTDFNEFNRMRSVLGDITTTDDIAEYLPSTDLRKIYLKNIYDGGFGDVIINNNRPGNYLKSRVGNIGFYDLDNPHVYKSFGGSLSTAGDPVLNFIQSQSSRFSKSKK